MMKHLAVAGVLAVAALGLAGTAAADIPGCEFGNLGLMSYDYYNVCVLDLYSYESPPYYSYSNYNVANLYYYGYEGSDYSYSNAYLQQYAAEDCWSTPCGSNGGTYGGFYTGGAQGGEYYSLGAGVSQYYGDYPAWGYMYSGTGAGVSGSAGGEYFSLYYNQNSFNGDCNEQLYYYDSSGFNEIIPYGPCTIEIPLLPELPQL